MSAFSKLAARVQQAVEADQKKIGGMTFGASARLGLEELRQGVSLEGSVADQTATPYGMYGTQTPGEVAQARENEGTVHGPAESNDQASRSDPVSAARQAATASAAMTKDRDTGHGMG